MTTEEQPPKISQKRGKMNPVERMRERMRRHLIDTLYWPVEDAAKFDSPLIKECVEEEIDACQCHRKVFNEPCGYYISDENGIKYL